MSGGMVIIFIFFTKLRKFTFYIHIHCPLVTYNLVILPNLVRIGKEKSYDLLNSLKLHIIFNL